MNIQIGFKAKGVQAPMTHVLEIKDKDTYNVDKLEQLLNEELKLYPAFDVVLTVDKILYSIQLENIPD